MVILEFGHVADFIQWDMAFIVVFRGKEEFQANLLMVFVTAWGMDLLKVQGPEARYFD